MAPLSLDNTLRAGDSGVLSVSAFTGDDCSTPKDESVAIGLCGVVNGYFRKEKGCFDDGVDGGGKICELDGPMGCTGFFGGESR